MADRVRSTQRDAPSEAVAGATARVADRAADAIADVTKRAAAGDVGGAADSAASAASGAAADLKSAALESGRHIVDEARQRATGFADRRKDEAAQSVADVAASLRETGKSFGERPNIQALVGSAADGLDQLATGLRDRSFADIYADVEDYARRSPATVGIVAVAAGFLLARFIKSSAEEMSEASAAERAREAAPTTAQAKTARSRPAATQDA